MNYSIKLARTITSGDVSNSNSKMLGSSFGLSPFHCKTGSKLALVEGSVCHGCYAKRGTGIYPSVKQGRINNQQAIVDGTAKDGLKSWVDAMVFLIEKRCKVNFHRWHDAGDLVSMAHYHAIIEIANRMPHIKFWLPTKEKKIINSYKGTIPVNLCVRLSGAMVDGLPPKTSKGIQTSTVHKSSTAHGFVCPAPVQDGACNSCTACYNNNVRNVSYHKH